MCFIHAVSWESKVACCCRCCGVSYISCVVCYSSAIQNHWERHTPWNAGIQFIQIYMYVSFLMSNDVYILEVRPGITQNKPMNEESSSTSWRNIGHLLLGFSNPPSLDRKWATLTVYCRVHTCKIYGKNWIDKAQRWKGWTHYVKKVCCLKMGWWQSCCCKGFCSLADSFCQTMIMHYTWPENPLL